MNKSFTFSGEQLEAHPSGALWLPDHRLLCVSDLHLCKWERTARRGGVMLPPYEVDATLDRLEDVIRDLRPDCILSLGDTFDDDAAKEALTKAQHDRLSSFGPWIWVTGNHDPGEGQYSHQIGNITFRHEPTGAAGEVFGHFHPKASLPGIGYRACFIRSNTNLLLPAFGTYTGGLRTSDPAIQTLFPNPAEIILTGPKLHSFPLQQSTR